MDTKRQNGFVTLFFTLFILVFSSTGYAGINNYRYAAVSAGAATSAALAFLFTKATPPSATSEAASDDASVLQLEAGAPQKFNIQDSQNDFGGNRIYLHSSLGPVKPSYIDLAKGEKKVVEITFSEVGKNNKLISHGMNEKRERVVNDSLLPIFHVVEDGQLAKDAALTGRITDSNHHQPIAGAVVKIFNDSSVEGEQEAQAVTDENGEYKFNNIFPGAFYLAVEKDGYYKEIKKTKIASKRTVTTNVALSCTCNAKGKVPVLLVPGIMGSYSKEKAPLLWPYPRLSPISPEWNSGELEMLDPFGQIGWGKVTKALQQHGYSKDCTIFTVPYDWSLSIPDIRDQYLKPWIDEAKKRSGSKQVDIIAHSMGGLVTRSYVQSDGYENDVRKFAMIGTPNKGAGNVYPIWEAGDPIEADIISGNTGITNPTAYFYTNTLSYFYSDRNWSNACTFGEIRRYEPSSCDQDKIYKLAHSKALSSGQLMPSYDDALLDKDSKEKTPIKIQENTFLKALNNTPCLNKEGCIYEAYDEAGNKYNEKYEYKNPADIFTNDIADFTKVYAKLFGGSDYDTINSIYVTPAPVKATLYKDGIPQSVARVSGDGTVLPKSVNINDYLAPDKPLEFIQKRSEHSALVGVFSNEVVQFITGASYNLKALEAINDVPQKTLVISINGRVQAHIHSENSLQLEKEHKIDVSSLVVSNPENGKYSITLNSVHQENYELSISYYDGVTNKLSAQRYFGYFDAKTKSFEFTLDNKNSNSPISFNDRSFSTPTALEVKKVDDKIQLDWKDEIGNNKQDVDHYEIYWKEDTEPYMHLLGIAQEKSYLTEHDWEKDKSISSYTVRAILKDGSSTFMSQPTFYIAEENKIMLRK